jgi:signal transduction histidine kinase
LELPHIHRVTAVCHKRSAIVDEEFAFARDGLECAFARWREEPQMLQVDTDSPRKEMKLPTILRAKSAKPASRLAKEREPFRKNQLIAGISGFAFSRFKDAIKIVHYEPGEIIFKENDRGDCLYLIAQGSVRISKKGRGGRQETLTSLSEKDFFGEMALVDQARRSAQATAHDHCLLGRVDKQAWALLLALDSSQVLSNFTRSFTKRLRSNNQHFIAEVMRNERLSLLGNTISSVAHDINNPLSSILAACEILSATNQDKIIDQLTNVIRDAVDRMQAMTRELLEFSRGNTRLDLYPTPIVEIMSELEDDFQRCAKMKIEVRREILYDGKVRLDRRRMLRAFSNLLRNAADAMKKAGAGILTFGVKRESDTVIFKVTDNGCGIPTEILPRIFEPFVTHGKMQGTGLGLAITKAIVEAHNGTITVRSVEKAGTTFEIRLPAGC